LVFNDTDWPAGVRTAGRPMPARTDRPARLRDRLSRSASGCSACPRPAPQRPGRAASRCPPSRSKRLDPAGKPPPAGRLAGNARLAPLVTGW